MSREVVQNVLGISTHVSREVYDMLALLRGFKVAIFRPRWADSQDAVPLDVRMRIMADSISKLVKRSIPVERGEERRLCRDRADKLCQGFARGVDALAEKVTACPRALKDSRIREVLCMYIDADMDKWATGVRTEAVGFIRSFFSPPLSERDLHMVRTPDWVRLQAFLNTGQMELAEANHRASTKPTAAGASSASRHRRQTCQRFLQGECDSKAESCLFFHPKNKRSGSALGTGEATAAAPPARPSKKRKKKAKPEAA